MEKDPRWGPSHSTPAGRFYELQCPAAVRLRGLATVLSNQLAIPLAIQRGKDAVGEGSVARFAYTVLNKEARKCSFRRPVSVSQEFPSTRHKSTRSNQPKSKTLGRAKAKELLAISLYNSAMYHAIVIFLK